MSALYQKRTTAQASLEWLYEGCPRPIARTAWHSLRHIGITTLFVAARLREEPPPGLALHPFGSAREGIKQTAITTQVPPHQNRPCNGANSRALPCRRIGQPLARSTGEIRSIQDACSTTAVRALEPFSPTAKVRRRRDNIDPRDDPQTRDRDGITLAVHTPI